MCVILNSRTMYVVPMEQAWKDESNYTKYSKSKNRDVFVF